MIHQLTARPAFYLAILLASIGAATPVSRASAPPPAPVLASASDVDLIDATTLDASGVWRGVIGQTPEILHLALPTAGIATIEVATPRVDLNPVRLDIHRLGRLTGTTILDRSANRLVLATRDGGSWWLRIAARDVGRYKVVTSFAPARVLDQHFELDNNAGSESLHARRTSFYATDAGQPPVKSQPEVIDPDPDTAGGDTDRLLARFWRLTTSVPHKSQPEVIDPDPDTAGTFGIETDHIVHYQTPCLADDRDDDHGDTSSCATPLRFGERVTGTVDNDSGDDADVFALTLTEVATVEVRLAEIGETIPTVIANLDDCAGRRLAADLDVPITDLDDRALVATLGPGRYCVRVEGEVTSGPYALEVLARTP